MEEKPWQDGFGAPREGVHAGAARAEAADTGVSPGCSPPCLQAALHSGQQ